MKIQQLDKELSRILQHMVDSEEDIQRVTAEVHPEYRVSAKNLYRYLILRGFDLRKYHGTLSDIGLSSMRTAEGYVLSNLYNVVKNIRLIRDEPVVETPDITMLGFRKSKKLLIKHANTLFNEARKKHFTEIMVTLPDEAADDPDVIRNMVLSGMEVARINLSHGDLEMWRKMVDIIREVQEETRQEVKIYMDLSGPKIRTADIEVRNKKGKIKNGVSIKKGEHLILTKRETPGRESTFGALNEQLEKAEIGIQLPEIIDDANVGDVLLFDDGTIRSKIIAKGEDELEVVITDCHKKRLSAHKGINLPNTKLNLPALTDKDIENLPFICEHADIVGYSFVRTAGDVKKLYTELDKHGADTIGVVFKIENKEAFENLPEILFEGMTRSKIGVMIARGDLAVEIGFDRISEVQNQILWLCEAAHVPVIWATQVLENLAKTGMPTRAEISDAAQGALAECVMLNKGPYINQAIKILKNILIRMEGHSFKKKNELRSLNVSKRYLEKINGPTLSGQGSGE